MASVLVVDDEEDIRELVRINLEIDGHEVITVAGGAEALERMAAWVPDIVLLDLMMPGMDGWELLGHMKAARVEMARVPVLMLTARSDDMDRIRSSIEGAIRYITKPFSLTELRDEVKAALEGDPEPVKRRRVQNEALERLARIEGGSGSGVDPNRARPRLTRLEGAPEAKAPPPARPRIDESQIGSLSVKQRQLLDAVGSTPTVRAAAEQLQVSRSNVYASLRRIARKLAVPSVPELVTLARQGGFPTPPAP